MPSNNMIPLAVFIFLDSKITTMVAEVMAWSQLKCLLFGKKEHVVATTNLDSIFKSRDITLPTKVCIVKVMVFPVVMYGCESWTIRRLSTEELMILNCSVGKDS